MIASASALTWESPDSNTAYIPGGYTLNVSGDSANESKTVDFYYDEGNGWEQFESGVSNSGSTYWTVEGIDNNLGTVENLDLKANFSGSSDFGDTTTVTLDKGGPDTFSLLSPGDYISSDSTTVDVEVLDDYSGTQNITVNVTGNNGDEINSNTCQDTTTCEVDVDNLDNGETYDVEMSGYDNVGNPNSDTESFTVDTSYEGPEDFSFDPSPGIIDVDEENREIDVTLEDENNDETDIDVECRVDGDDEDSFTIDTSDGDGDSFTCEIPDDFDGQMFDLELYLEDQAGNSFTADGEEFGFDSLSPTVSYLRTVENVSNFGQDFDVEYSVSDDVSDVEMVEYYVDEGPGEGEVNGSQQLSEASGEFTLDTEGLSEGEHTLYLRAEDAFGKWSTSRALDFNFYPGESPEASMSVVEDLNITSGSTETVDVTLDNTGRILVPGGDLTASGFADGQNVSYGSFAPNESVMVGLELSPTDEHLGQNDITVSASSVDASSSISVLVEADSQTQDELQTSLDEQVAQYENLSSRVESLRSGLSQSRRERLNSDFSELESSIQEARTAAENGEYYRVDQMLSDLSNQVQATQETYNTVKQEQQTDDRNTLIMVGVGIFLALIGAGVGFVMYSDEYEFDVDLGSSSEDEDVSVSSEEDSEGLVDKVKSKIEELRGGEEESDEPEYEFK